MLDTVYIPRYITVHLGAPSNASAQNVTVDFAHYIKNVASPRDVVLVIAGVVGDVEAVSPAGIPFGENPVKGVRPSPI